MSRRNLRLQMQAAAIATAIAAVLAVGAGCHPEMRDQPRAEPLEASDFFADGLASRPVVPGTVARGQLAPDPVLVSGRRGEQFAPTLPFPATALVLARGRQRFDIHCSPCHGRVGDGLGMVVRRGFKQPPSFHIERLRRAPPGYFFDVETNGFGAMPSYASQVPPADRWAIVAYLRALQRSQNASLADVPAAERERLERERRESQP